MPGEAPSPSVQLVPVPAAAVGQRIDNFLLARLKGVPRSHVYRILRGGEVRVNKGRVRSDYRLQAGDLVRIPPVRLAEPREPGLAPSALLRGLEAAILYEDERLLAIDKPAALAVHGGSGLSFGLIEAMRQLRPGMELELVHRLDRDTSGCLLLAKRSSTLRDLHRLIRDQAVEKRYLALLTRPLPRAELTVDAPLLKNTLKSGERVVRVDPAAGKPSRTRFRRLRGYPGPQGGLELVEARLLTGRTHQIRVHAAHLGAPLAGDEKYGDEGVNQALRPLGLRRLFLHAADLSFQPAHLSRPLRLQAPLPPELQALLARLEEMAKKE